MSTLRSRIPVLLSELMFNGVKVEFGNSFMEPMISWRYHNGECGHSHMTQMVQHTHGSNSIDIERVLTQILADMPKKIAR